MPALRSRLFKAVFISFVTSALLAGSGLKSEAWAQRSRVIVELFNGPNAERVRLAVVRAILQQRGEVVSIKKVAMVEADLGLIRASDNYTAVARELKANAFVSGTILPGRRPRLRLVVRGPDGSVVGQTMVGGIAMPRLVRNIGAVGPKLLAMAGEARGGGTAVAAKGPRDSDPLFSPGPKGGSSKPVLAEAEEPVAPEKPDKEEPPAKEEEPEAPAAKPTASRGGDADVEAESEAPPAKGRKSGGTPGSTGLNVAFVMRMFSRNFNYNQNAQGMQQGYQAPERKFNNLPLVPAPGLALEYFPISVVGANFAYNRAIVGSKDTNNSIYKTTAYDWSLAAKGRIDVVGMQFEPSLGYTAKVFSITNFMADINRIQVAPVSYSQVRVGGGVRLPLASGAAISAGGAYLHTLGAGEILNPGTYFGGNALAGELYAAMTMPLGFAKGFDLRFGADFRRIAFAFTADLTPSSGRIAGGAVDQYIGVNIGIGYNLDI